MYEWAKKTLSGANIKKLSDEELQTLTDTIETYESDAASQAASTKPEELSRARNEPTSFLGLGPTGMDVLEQRIPVSPETPFGRSLPHRSREQDLAIQKNLAPNEHAPMVSREEELHLDLEHPIPPPVEVDKSKPSASGVPDLYRPPEFIPEDAKGMAALPSRFGGKVDHFVEPTIEQFRRDMGPTLGTAYVNAVSEQDPEFKQYADAQWANIYDQAKAAGKGAVRHEYAQDDRWLKETGHQPTLGEKAGHAALSGEAGLGALAYGLDQGLTAGLGGRALDALGLEDRSNLGRLAEKHPVVTNAGRLAGAMSPVSVGNLAARGTGAALKSAIEAPGLGLADILPEAALTTSPLGGALAAGTKGGVAGATDVLANAAGGALAGEPTDWNATKDQAITAAALGGTVGMGMDVAGQGAGALSQGLREHRPDIAEAERIGGRTNANPFNPFEPGEGYQRLKALQRQDEITPLARETRDLAHDLTMQGRTEEETTAKQIGQQVAEYHALTEGVREPATDLLKEAMRLHDKRTNFDGTDLRDNRDLRSYISRTSDVQAVKGDAFAHLKAAQALDPGSIVLDGDQAIRRGVDVRGAIQRWGRENGVPINMRGGLPAESGATETEASLAGTGVASPEAREKAPRAATEAPDPHNFKFIVKPKPYNPEKFDEILDDLTADVKPGENKKVDPALPKLLAEAYKVRDKFPAVGPAAGRSYTLDNGQTVHGYSALNQEHADTIQASKDSLASVGLPGKPGPRPGFRTRQQVENQLRTYATARDVPADTVEGLREMAAAAGKGEQLRGLKGIKATERLVEGGAPAESAGEFRGRPFTSLRLPGARMALDPILSTLGLAGGEHTPIPEGRPYIRHTVQSPFRLRGGGPGGGIGYTLSGGTKETQRTLTPEEAEALRRALILQGTP